MCKNGKDDEAEFQIHKDAYRVAWVKLVHTWYRIFLKELGLAERRKES